MENFDCLICSTSSTYFKTIIQYKKHLTSAEHKKKYLKIFTNEVYQRNRHSYTPWIFIIDPNKNQFCPHPALGLSQMTLCFSSDVQDGFYLCHVCERKFHMKAVPDHIFQENHYANYFAYNDPNMLSFLSNPIETHSTTPMMVSVQKELEKMRPGRLQILQMPESLFQECDKGTYCQAMFLLHQNKSLSQIYKEKMPERIQILRYRDDSNRKHPLLGLQYIVECVCVPHRHLKQYLCLMCGSQTNNIIRHLLSFHHVYTYLNIWHPTTLYPEKCYKTIVGSDDHRTLTDFAKQSEKLQGPIEIQQVTLETSQMLSVLKLNFIEALDKIKSITKKDSLMPIVKHGKKLEPTILTNKKANIPKQECASEPVTSGNSDLIQKPEKENKELTNECSATPAEPSYNFHCQNCIKNFKTNALYFKHLSLCEHQENFEKNFKAVMNPQTDGCKSNVPTFTLIQPDKLYAGASLVLTILCHQLKDEPVHLCIACETVFPMKNMNLHMNSEKHIVQCLMYINPWKLPFAWKTTLDFSSLKSLALIEEEERGTNKIIRILDVPPSLFPSDTSLSYSNVMEKLAHYQHLLMNEVPQCETFCKLQDNETFPILGRNFLVKYGHTTSGWKFLCLLCEHTLSSADYTGHVFSWEHVVAFLEKFHPGSVDLNITNEEMLLDLAKQAAGIHPVLNAQEIKFDECSSKACMQLSAYSTKVRQLSAVSLAAGKGPIIPSISPKEKLFLRQTEKTTNEKNTERKVQSIPNAVEKSDVSKSAVVESVEITKLSIKQEVKEENLSEPSQSEESVKNCFPECKPPETMNAASRSERSPSDMDTSDSETEALDLKQMCQTNPHEENTPADFQNVEKTKLCTSSETPVDTPVLCRGRELLSFIQKKIRPAVIGLSMIYECVYEDRAPIYLCESCHLRFKEERITKHVCEIWHYRTYLTKSGEHPLPQGKSWKKDMANLAVYWERSEGPGHARVVKMTSEDYEALESTDEYFKALLIVKRCRVMKETNTKTDPVTVATSRTKPPPSHDTVSTKTPDIELSAVQTVVSIKVSQDLPKTSISPTPPPSTFPDNGQSSSTRDTSNSTNKDTSLKMVNTAPKSSKPVCTFISTRAVIPQVLSKVINTSENSVDQIQYDMCDSSAITGTPKPTTKPVCKFMSPKSETRNMSSPAMTQNKIQECTNISASSVSNTPKASLKEQDESVLPEANTKRKAESATGIEPASKVAMLGSNHSSAEKTESSSSHAKLLSPAPAPCSPKPPDVQAKSSKKDLKLNVKVAHVKRDDPELGRRTLTPTTPGSGVLSETSQKAPPKTPKIGVDHLIIVTCEDRRLVYCLACLTKLEASNHMFTITHQVNCVKLKFPRWCVNPDQEELSKMVALLYEDEKALKVVHKQVSVSLDIYKELKSLPNDEAIERARDLIKRKGSKKSCQRQPLVSTNEVSSSLCNITPSHTVSVRPCDVTNPDLGKDNSQAEIKSSPQPIKPLPVSATSASSPSSPVQKPTSVVAPRIIKGSTTDDLSNLSRILAVKDIAVIGLCFVWECRVVPPKHPTFYLCESCSQTIPVNEICDHMTSTLHCYMYLMRKYPQFMHWVEDELLPPMKVDLTNYIADLVKVREESMDAQTVLLSEECFEWVRNAPFLDALNVVQRIKEEKKTTTLPITLPITVPQQEVEPQELQLSQSTLDLSNICTDPSNSMEISTTDAEHQCDCDSCTADTDTMSSRLTDFLDSQSTTVGSSYSPKLQDEPACSPTDLNLAVLVEDEKQETFEPESEVSFDDTSPLSHIEAVKSPIVDTNEIISSVSYTKPPELNLALSPKDENQEYFEPEMEALSDGKSPSSHVVAAIASPADTTETTLSMTIEHTSGDLQPKADSQLDSSSNLETNTASPKVLENNDTKAVEENQATEECLCLGHSDASSTFDQNATENPPLDPVVEDEAALDKHYCLLLINLLKQTKNSMQQDITRNQTLPCKAKLSKSIVELCEVLRCERWDVEQPLITDADTAAEVDNTLTKNETGSSEELLKDLTSGTGASIKNAEKPSCDNVTSVFSGDLNEITMPDLATQSEEPLVPLKNGPREDSEILPKVQLQQNDVKIEEVKTENNESDVSVVISQLEVQFTQTESQYIAGPHSESQQSHFQFSQQKQELPLKSGTQKVSPKPIPPRCPLSIKYPQIDPGTLLQTKHNPVLTQQTQNQKMQLQPQKLAAQPQSEPQSRQSQNVHTRSNIAEAQLDNMQLQMQSQESRLLPQTHVALHTVRQMQQIPIDSRITLRQNNTKNLRRDTGHRQNYFHTNPSAQSSQGPIPDALPPATGSSVVNTGEYGQFLPPSYPSITNYFNTGAPHEVPYGTAHTSHVYHQLQTQQFYTSVPPFLQDVLHPEVPSWINPNTQQQPATQNFSAWSNRTGGHTTNVTHPNSVSYNTISNQSYTYYNRLQEYNTVLMRSLYYSSSDPTQTNPEFFPHKP